MGRENEGLESQNSSQPRAGSLNFDKINTFLKRDSSSSSHTHGEVANVLDSNWNVISLEIFGLNCEIVFSNTSYSHLTTRALI